jgi:hypothetical protein
MVNAKPGYWDVDRCSWVGVDPQYVVPPVRPAPHTHDRVVGADGVQPAAELPEPRPATEAADHPFAAG